MERGGVGYISPSYSAQDFLNLHLSLNSNNDDWNTAISIFRDRIESRYFTPIDAMLSRRNDIEQNGFAVMAINCLLVDSFYQFTDPGNIVRNGRRNESLIKTNTVCYTRFLRQNFPHIFNRNTAYYFYTDIRCGILHSAQTKNGSQLTYNKNYVVEVFDGDKIRVDVRNFSGLMRRYYNDYISKLTNGDVSLRQAFITQMTLVCTA